jgi:carbon-monoxide dehydrogenase large subunit
VSILGTRVLRTEDPAFLTRGAIYTDDVQDERLTGACYAHFVRSSVAHARIRAIDTSAALQGDGVIAVYTGADLAEAGLRPVPPMMPGINEHMLQPLLATDVVRFAGEPVAVVLTEQAYQGEDAVELVDVDYEPLPAVIDLDDALSGARGLLFPAAESNVAIKFGDEAYFSKELFDGCDVVVSETIMNQRVAPAPMETRAAAAVQGADGRLTAWIPNQGAQGAKAALAGYLGIAPEDLRVITPDVGGGFGAKAGADPEQVVVCWLAGQAGRPVRWTETRTENLLAMTHGRGQRQKITVGGTKGQQVLRPVRWTETRTENLLAMTHGRGQRQKITVGGTKDGAVLAYRLETVQDSGAYPKIAAYLPALGFLMTPGTYAIPKAEVVGISVVTNTTPIGAYRGAGRPEVTAALDRAMDLFAAEAGLDPAVVRRRNLLPKFTEPHTTMFGTVYDTGDYAAALEKALDAAGYEELRAEQKRRRETGDALQLGIGLSSYVEITGMSLEPGGPSENSTVEIHPDGTATILTGTSPHGQGHQTVWAMLASDELGIPVENITVKWGDTDLVPKGGGTGGSRSLQLGGAAVQQATRELLDVARERAAAALEASAADLAYDPATRSFSVKGDPDATVPITALAESERLFVHSVFSAPGATFPFGAHVAVVEVDTETGKVFLRRVVSVDDAGTVLNPLLAEGQRHGGIAQGAAQAFLEEVVYDGDGNPLTATFADYPFLSATEVPSFELVDMATPTTYNPLGAKGIGEAGTIGSTPAVQNAVIDAVAHLGVRHIDMPTSPQRVWRAINAARKA